MLNESVKYGHADDIGGLEYLKASYHKRNFGRHVHEGFCIGVIEQGAQGFYRSGGHHVAPANSIILVNADEVHTGHSETETGWSYQALYPLPDQLLSIGQNLKIGTPYFRSPVVQDAPLARLLRHLIQVLDESDCPLERQTCYLAAMTELVQRHASQGSDIPVLRKNQRAVSMVKTYLHDHYREGISLKTLSELVGLNEHYLIRLFRKQVGLPPHAYLVQVRVSKAKALIRRGVELATAAIDVGFTDQSHMARHFKRAYAVSPGRFVSGQRFYE